MRITYITRKCILTNSLASLTHAHKLCITTHNALHCCDNNPPLFPTLSIAIKFVTFTRKEYHVEMILRYEKKKPRKSREDVKPKSLIRACRIDVKIICYKYALALSPVNSYSDVNGRLFMAINHRAP